jgi:hypothetical protein
MTVTLTPYLNATAIFIFPDVADYISTNLKI